jgi:hypothetical protein
MIVLITATVAPERKTAFHNVVKSHANIWWHYIDSTWMVRTESDPSEWISWLKPVIHESEDSIFVTKIDGYGYSGWLPQKAYDWIKTNR